MTPRVAGGTRFLQLATLLITVVIASGCVKQPLLIPAEPATIGPYSNFSARLIAIEPKRRWQVILQWHADTPERGDLRLTHAASGTIVEFRWFGKRMQSRDNHSRLWKEVDAAQLATQGMVIPPQQLASILLGEMPNHFIEKKPNLWESSASGSLIRLQWKASSKQLTMTDTKHGRQVKLLIQP
ncbi:hypothetical protein Ga0123461_1931 [Mariprofundus aestuarium]|uniref:Outer-membrane lipoprotein LolB n=1 Tax=Mariprofundus aestuarium TaxID=1921086 RepID=A0A2K8KZB4_MARES|nr:hypothetical protein [Mariprofundus aestuarium]ATX80338.1 hypothetical protein Ga0123461_1931 [Mariprofundus aestuarium]